MATEKQQQQRKKNYEKPRINILFLVVGSNNRPNEMKPNRRIMMLGAFLEVVQQFIIRDTNTRSHLHNKERTTQTHKGCRRNSIIGQHENFQFLKRTRKWKFVFFSFQKHRTQFFFIFFLSVSFLFTSKRQIRFITLIFSNLYILY